MNQSKLKLLSAMGIFGTIGVFVKYLPIPSASLAFFRGVMGVLFLLGCMLVTGQKPDKAAIRKNFWILVISGGAIGFNWILLFEAYRYTTVATATVCYYLAPLFLLLLSPLLGEKLTLKKVLCISVALVGMIFVSGVMEGGMPSFAELRGVLMGIGAAILYASVMFMNKKLSPIPAYDKTNMQLGAASLVILPYLLMTQGFGISGLTGIQWGILVTLGVVHTGIAYALYFGSMKDIPSQTIAIFSYIDPVVAVLLSTLVLRETITLWGILGTALILGSALYSELSPKH